MTLKRLFLVLIPLGIGLATTGFSQEIKETRKIKDSTQVTTQLSEQPLRIITLAPSLGELVADLIGNQTERLIGVSERSDYPPYLKKITPIGPYNQVNLEKIVSLKPDLVLATQDGNSKDQILHLRELQVPVVVVNTENIRGIEESIRLVAAAIGAISEGDRMVQQLKTGLDRIRKRGESNPPTQVLFQVGDEPVVVAGGKSFLNEMLETVGAKNLYGDLQSHYPRPSLEDLLHRNPDVIVVATMGEDSKPSFETAARWGRYSSLKAVKKRQVYVLKADALLRPTLRILEGLSLLEKTIYKPNHEGTAK